MIFAIYSPIAWVRKLAFFEKGFFMAVCMVGISLATTSYFAFKHLDTAGVRESAPGYVAVNTNDYWSMIGYAFFMFEGIGVLLPIMRETEKPENFSMLTFAA